MPRTEIDDQLPYIQVHRSVGTKAAQLATPLKVTYQHVRGALDVFWEGIADRRILGEAISRSAATGAEPQVTFTTEDLSRRLARAFGMEVPLALLEGDFIEAVGEGRWRVLGADRYLGAEQTRLARKRGDTGVGVGSDPGPTPTAPGFNPGPTPVQPRSDPAPTPQRKEARGEREEGRGKTEEAKGDVGPADAFWQWAQGLRFQAGCVQEAPLDSRNLGGWYSVAMLELNGDDHRLREAWLRFGEDTHWQQARPPCPFKAFMHAETGWRKYVPRVRRAS